MANPEHLELLMQDMEKERESKRTMLFPVRLDDSVNAIKSGRAAYVRRTRHIGDFSKWKSHDE